MHWDTTIVSAHATSILPFLPLKGRQYVKGFQGVNMSFLSVSYSKTESSTSGHSSSDESVERGEPSKNPEPKVIVHEAQWVPWAPKHDIPVATVTPRQVAPMVQFGAATADKSQVGQAGLFKVSLFAVQLLQFVL